jgi:selenocysteine lyase/cysteine desulfurase
MERRYFISQAALLAGAVSLPTWGWSANNLEWETGLSEGLENAADEEAWKKIADQFPKPKGFIQLEHGYFSHALQQVLQFQHIQELNIQSNSSFFMRRDQVQSIEQAREALAEYFGWDKETLALTRNTTESLNTIIQGYPWKAGDEVVIGQQDYGTMTESFQQASERYGVVIRYATIPLIPENDDQIINTYLSLVNERTRMLHLTHMINLSGQVIPLDKIIQKARALPQKERILIVVDAAHSVAHIPYSWKDCDADVVAGSLHKWMCAPIGIGFLKIRKEHITLFWPLMADRSLAKTDIRRFEHQGTRPIQAHLGLVEAIKAQAMFGSLRNKAARLFYLKNYWTEKLKDVSGVQIQTPLVQERSGAITNIAMDGMTAEQLAAALWDRSKIFTVAVVHPAIKGVRITPHLSTSIDELDVLVNSLKEISKKK